MEAWKNSLKSDFIDMVGLSVWISWLIFLFNFHEVFSSQKMITVVFNYCLKIRKLKLRVTIQNLNQFFMNSLMHFSWCLLLRIHELSLLSSNGNKYAMGPLKSILWRKTGSSVLPNPDHYYIVFFGKQFLHFKEGQPDFKDTQCVLRIHNDILKQDIFINQSLSNTMLTPEKVAIRYLLLSLTWLYI